MPRDAETAPKLRGTDRRIAGNTAWLLGERVLRAIVGLPVAVALTRHLGPESFGELSYGLAWTSIAATIAGLGLDSIVIRDLVRGEKPSEQIIATVAGIKLASCGCTALIAIALLLAVDGSNATTTPLTLILLGSLAFQFVEAADYFFQSRTEAHHVVIPRCTAMVAGSAFKLWLVHVDATAFQIAWAHVLESGLGALLLSRSFRSATGAMPSPAKASIDYSRSLIADAWPLAMAAIAVVLYMRMDVIMLQQLASPDQVGVYVAAARLSEFWYAIPTAWVASAAPSLIARHQTDPTLMVQALVQTYRRMFYVSLVWILAIQSLAPEIIHLLYGPAFEGSADVLRIHAWTSIAVSWGVASSQYLIIHNRQAVSLARTAGGLLANCALNSLLIPRYGANGAAFATLGSYFVATFSIALHRPSRGHAWQMLKSIAPAPRIP
jgi:O-antigen/teichoic acid export membrane protein